MLKPHYTLKCTSWLISSDLLKACVTPPTTSVCKEGRVGTNGLVHLWREVSRGACGLKTALSVLLMRAARTFQLLSTPSDRKNLQYFKAPVFQNDHIASKFRHVLSLKIAEDWKPAKILNQEWLKSQKRPQKWFIDDLQFENESLSCFLHTLWRQIGLGRSCRELSAFESCVEGRQQPLKTPPKSFKINKNRYRSVIFFICCSGLVKQLVLSPNITIVWKDFWFHIPKDVIFLKISSLWSKQWTF